MPVGEEDLLEAPRRRPGRVRRRQRRRSRRYGAVADESLEAGGGCSAPEDLVQAGLVFRRFAVEHPSLFRIAFQSTPSDTLATPAVRSAANTALAALKGKIVRLDGTGLTSSDDATLLFHALCEGLARLELRGNFPVRIAEQQWKEGVEALVRGLTSQQGNRQPPRRTGHQRPS